MDKGQILENMRCHDKNLDFFFFAVFNKNMLMAFEVHTNRIN